MDCVDPSWKSTVGFAERLAVMDKIATSLESASPTLQRPEAMRQAQLEEAKCMTDAVSKSDYIRLWSARLEELQARASSPALLDGEPFCISDDETAQCVGPYHTAVPVASGIFSTIYKASPTLSTPGPKSSVIALKVTNTSSAQPPHDCKREVRLLNVASGHKRIITLLESFTLPPSTVVLVFPYLPYTLDLLLEKDLLKTPGRVPSIIHDVLEGITYLHSLGILHRDIKPSNILFSSPTSSAIIADFGISWLADDRSSEPTDEKITDVGTTCYRAPELLFGFRGYGQGLDMWAVGCVLAECLDPKHKQFFEAGDLGSELRLIASIFMKLGTPKAESWPESVKFPDFGKIQFHEFPALQWENLLPFASKEARSLVSKLLVYESGDRISAEEALKHPFFEGIPGN